jgi:hypothetical protein
MNPEGSTDDDSDQDGGMPEDQNEEDGALMARENQILSELLDRAYATPSPKLMDWGRAKVESLPEV